MAHEDGGDHHEYAVDFETDFPMDFLKFSNETLAFTIATNGTTSSDIGQYKIVVKVKDEHDVEALNPLDLTINIVELADEIAEAVAEAESASQVEEPAEE